jgi:hypothetical protein
MDIIFSNRISAQIFKQCAQHIVDQQLYTSTPIELRKKIEDCFDIYLDQSIMVSKGLERAPPVPEPTLE